MQRLARSLDDDAFVKRNFLALSDITSQNDFKAGIENTLGNAHLLMVSVFSGELVNLSAATENNYSRPLFTQVFGLTSDE